MSAPKRTATALLATGALLLGGTASASAACPGEDVWASEQSMSATEASLLCLINERRRSAGVGTVVPNGQLAAAAHRHASDMVDRGYFSHTAPGGVSFIDRIVGTGYTDFNGSWLVGENLVWGTGPLSTPKQMVQAWMNSPAHRENLLRDRFREIGLAAVPGTPRNASDRDGVTVASEYGYRSGVAPKRAKKKARRARAAKRRARIAAKRRARARARS